MVLYSNASLQCISTIIGNDHGLVLYIYCCIDTYMATITRSTPRQLDGIRNDNNYIKLYLLIYLVSCENNEDFVFKVCLVGFFCRQFVCMYLLHCYAFVDVVNLYNLFVRI